jgi:hypothetical protein
MLIVGVLIGCASTEQGAKTVDGKGSATHSPDVRVNQNEDVIYIHGRVQNLGKLNAFVERESTKVRIVHYTIEGDPIFDDVSYEQDRVKVRRDNTQDHFGTPVVMTYSCSRLNKEETETQLLYTLSGCDGEDEQVHLFRWDYDVERQDTFEFALRYGFEGKNVIDTFQNRVVKDLVTAGTAEIKDFKLTPKERQTIYKEMVLANYLESKELSMACNVIPYGSYDLTVSINDAEHQYQWSQCDRSRDGLDMLKVAETIIEVVLAREDYQKLPPAQGGYQ